MHEGESENQHIAPEESAGFVIAEKTTQHLEEVVGLNYDPENTRGHLVRFINERLESRGIEPLTKEAIQAVGNSLIQACEAGNTINRDMLKVGLTEVITEHLKNQYSRASREAEFLSKRYKEAKNLTKLDKAA
jgi:hypothetical protein